MLLLSKIRTIGKLVPNSITNFGKQSVFLAFTKVSSMGMVSTPSLKLREHCKSYASYWCSGWPLSGTARPIPICCTPSPLSQITNPNLLHLLLLRDSPDNLSSWLLLWSEVKRATFPPWVPLPFTLLFHVKGISPGKFERFLGHRADVTPIADLIRAQTLEAESESRGANAFRKQPPRQPSARNVSRAAPSWARKEEPRAEDCGTLEDWTRLP